MKLIEKILLVISLSFLIFPITNATLVSFRGYVFIDNQSAPTGTVVGVYEENGTLLQQREVYILNNGAYYILDVDAPSRVFFKVAGVNSSEGIVNVGEGGLYRLNLSINSLPNGQPCEYDQACSSGICCNGVCSESCTTTTVPSGSSGGSSGSGGTSGYEQPSSEISMCESDFTISAPSVLKGEIGKSVSIPVTINVNKVTCPPLTVYLFLDAPNGWKDERRMVEGLREGDKRKIVFDLDIPNVSEGLYTIKIECDGKTKYIDINVKRHREGEESGEEKNETIIPEPEVPTTGFSISLTREPLTVVGIIIAIIVLYFVIKRSRKP